MDYRKNALKTAKGLIESLLPNFESIFKLGELPKKERELYFEMLSSANTHTFDQLKLIEKYLNNTKSTPKDQETIDWGLGNAGYCENCYRNVNYQFKYCPGCGVELDWSCK